MSHPESTWQRVESSLLGAPMFEGAQPANLQALIRQGTLHRFETGQNLQKLLRKSQSIGWLVDGPLRSLIHFGPEDVQPLRKLPSGSPLGWITHLNGLPCESYLAAQRVIVLELELPRFLAWLATEPEIEKRLTEAPYPEEIGFLLSQSELQDKATFQRLKTDPESFEFQRLPSDETPGTEEAGAWKTPSSYASKPSASRAYTRWFRWSNSTSPEKEEEIPAQEEEPAPIEVDKTIANTLSNEELIHAHPGVPAAVACLEMIAKAHHKKFRGEVVTRYLRDQTGDLAKTPTLMHLGSTCEMQGWPARLLKIDLEHLVSVPAPAILLKDGQPVYLQESSQSGVLFASPIEGSLLISREQLTQHFPGNLEVLTLQVPASDAPQKFGLSWFLPVLKQHRRVLIEVFLASLLVQLFALANPVVTQLIIDKVLVQNSPGTLHVLGCLLALLVIAGTVTSALRTYLFVDTTNRIDLTLGGKVADRLYRLTMGYFGKRPVGEISSRLNELENIRQFLTGTVLTILLDGLFALIYIGLMLFYSVKLTLVALAALPLFAFITLIITPIYQAQIRQRAKDRASSQAYLVETVTGIQTIKSQNLEYRARGTWQERYATYIASSFKTTITSTTFTSLTGMLGKFSDLAVLWVGTLLVIDGKLTLGQLIAFRIISGYVSNPLLRLIQSWQNFQEVALSVERLGDVMNADTEQPPEQGQGMPLPSIRGEVQFENLSFRYQPNTPQTLSDVTAHVKPGMFVGVVGLSGSGKSTLVKTLTRLCVPESGKVLIDGYDLAKVELSSIREQVATVLQDSLLFDISIEENIALSRPSATSEEIVQAAKIARAHDFIMKMPLGYATPAGEQGRNMSGGQRQRVALARSILQNPKIFILDEATSALDVPTEREVCHNLRQTFQDRTILFVTHRLHNLDRADLILVLEDGVLIESGSHAELISAKGLYATLYKQIQG